MKKFKKKTEKGKRIQADHVAVQVQINREI